VTVKVFSVGEDAGSDTIFNKLPTELLEEILFLVDLPTAGSLMKASKSTYRLVQSLMDTVSLHQILHGSLRWILPVDAVSGENSRAVQSLRTWKPNHEGPGETIEEWLKLKDFPWCAFVRQCFGLEEDSMRNRRRMWSIVEQIRPCFDKVPVRSGTEQAV
jgi:hypothetical protein